MVSESMRHVFVCCSAEDETLRCFFLAPHMLFEQDPAVSAVGAHLRGQTTTIVASFRDKWLAVHSGGVVPLAPEEVLRIGCLFRSVF